ncbi:uncharacterized protein BO96DRAFT_3014 [Aspergillus niger CBS 101883]|uniref:uncharacterized protein n=1 Tax=Aspergillus lacticoffeatus (strain CBS 101883) TaxID=1450533 RepID=UPI000D7F1827|nr:uncharacterized protein BO96DRAFT_3014 [Aspergillus niger CBS 101883]PYH61825.1 hypothetical protein BO96DRAFT_3014 [Aspergillus niger CBS 101883]
MATDYSTHHCGSRSTDRDRPTTCGHNATTSRLDHGLVEELTVSPSSNRAGRATIQADLVCAWPSHARNVVLRRMNAKRRWDWTTPESVG